MTEAMENLIVLCVYEGAYEIDDANMSQCVVTEDLHLSIYSLLFESNCAFLEDETCSILVFQTTSDEVVELTAELAHSEVMFVKKYLNSSKCRTLHLAKNGKYHKFLEKILAARGVIYETTIDLANTIYDDSQLPAKSWEPYL